MARVRGIGENKARGERIEQLRQDLSLSQEELAKRTGRSVRAVGDWGGGKSMLRSTFDAVVAELGTTADYLEHGRGPVERPPDPIDHLSERLAALEVRLSDRIRAVETELHSMAESIEDLVVSQPLAEDSRAPGSEAGQLPDKDEPAP